MEEVDNDSLNKAESHSVTTDDNDKSNIKKVKIILIMKNRILDTRTHQKEVHAKDPTNA